MFEWALIIGMSVVMSKIATADDENGLMWGLATFFLCLGTLFTPVFPFLRVMLAGVLAFILMIVAKVVRER